MRGPSLTKEQPPIMLLASVNEIEWGFENGVCYKEPKSRIPVGPMEKKKFIPYGCTNLRLTELPLLN